MIASTWMSPIVTRFLDIFTLEVRLPSVKLNFDFLTPAASFSRLRQAQGGTSWSIGAGALK